MSKGTTPRRRPSTCCLVSWKPCFTLMIGASAPTRMVTPLLPVVPEQGAQITQTAGALEGPWDLCASGRCSTWLCSLRPTVPLRDSTLLPEPQQPSGSQGHLGPLLS